MDNDEYYKMFLSKYDLQELRREKYEKRCKKYARWLIDNPKHSIRKIAEEFMVSKSQVHRDIHALKTIDYESYIQCMNILDLHTIRRQ